MSGISQWAFSICCAMVACGLAQILLPKSSLTRVFNLCVSVFFLCCLLTPIVLKNPELRIEIVEYSQEDINNRSQKLAKVVEEQSHLAAEQNLKKIVEEKLLEMGINYISITIHINTSVEKNAQNPVARIKLDEGHDARRDKIKEDLTKQLGIDVELV